MKVSIIDWIVKKLKKCIGIVEDGDTASSAISKGQYVVWKGSLYTADGAISSGTTLAADGGSKNLTAVTDGGLNSLNSKITSQETDLASVFGGKAFVNSGTRTVVLVLYKAINTSSAEFTLPNSIPRPNRWVYAPAGGCDVSDNYTSSGMVYISPSTGKVTIKLGNSSAYAFSNIVYGY